MDGHIIDFWLNSVTIVQVILHGYAVFVAHLKEVCGGTAPKCKGYVDSFWKTVQKHGGVCHVKKKDDSSLQEGRLKSVLSDVF